MNLLGNWAKSQSVKKLVFAFAFILVGSFIFACTHVMKQSPKVLVQKHAVELPSPEIEALAKKFSPIFIHELGPNPKADQITGFNFDGDWVGDNNWKGLDNHELSPRIYFEVLSTKTHYFLMYGAYHPRDYSYFCITMICHENDMEGVLVIVDRKTAEWIYTESIAHDVIYSQENTTHQSRPTLVIEWGGHGIYPPAKYSVGKSTKIYNDYSLEPIATLWNLQFKEMKMFDGEFDYRGSRFNLKNIPQAFLGRAWTRGSAHPPWAWIDLVQGPRGEVFFDPAFYFSKKHSHVSVDLVYQRNPYIL